MRRTGLQPEFTKNYSYERNSYVLRFRAFPFSSAFCFLHSSLLLVLVFFSLPNSFAQTSILVPMKADRLLTNSNAKFTADDHAPDGVLQVSKGEWT